MSTDQLFLAGHAAHRNRICAQLSGLIRKHRNLVLSTRACLQNIRFLCATLTRSLMAALLTSVCTTIQSFATKILALITNFDAIDDRLILSTKASGQVFVAARITKSIVAVLVTLVLFAIKELLTLLTTYEGLFLV